MKTRYDVPEIVWNSYEVTGIDEPTLTELLKDEPNIWHIQNQLAEQGIQITIELAEACYEFIETIHEQGELRT